MTSKEFVTTKLNGLVDVYPSLTFKYKFLSNENIHLIEVIPFSEYSNNRDYLASEGSVVYEFENTFLQEEILFVSEDSITRVEIPDSIISKNNVSIFMDTMIDPEYEYGYIEILNSIEIQNNNYALAA